MSARRRWRRLAATALACLFGLGLAAPTALAIPDGGASPNTPGTWSRVSPKKLAGGSVLHFTVGGFPAGETLYIKIDDGTSCADTSHGACVYHTQKIPSSGVVNGSFTVPSSLGKGKHWLRFLASTWVDADDHSKGTKGFTNASPKFTITTAATSKTAGRGETVTVTQGETKTSSGGVAKAKAGAAAKEPSKTPASPVADGAELKASATGDVRATAGEGQVVLDVGTDRASEWAYVFAYSSPTGLGWQQVSVEGTVTVPTDDLAAGEHRFAVLDVDSKVVGWAQAEVAAAASPSATAAPTETATPSAVPVAAAATAPSVGLVAIVGAVLVGGAAIAFGLWRRSRNASE
ncbi:MAG: hypothetical protein QM779_01305 [Propionicimonas sp.]|uniref:hypothetical protein n=1 Tax=Propionicimonas sp. TaxID=1955623 RepID=UPI003D0BCD1A